MKMSNRLSHFLLLLTIPARINYLGRKWSLLVQKEQIFHLEMGEAV